MKSSRFYQDMSVVHTLKFPSSWMAKPLLPPCAQEGKLSENVIAWLKDHQLVPTDKVLRHLQAMDIDTYGGYSCPKASEKAIFLWTCYVTLWLLWDDVDVEKTKPLDKNKDTMNEPWMKESLKFFDLVNIEASKVLATLHKTVSGETAVCSAVPPRRPPPLLEEMVQGVRGQAVSKNNLFNVAWRDLGQELRREGCSDAFMTRLAHNMHFWLQYTLGETELSQSLGAYPNDTLNVKGSQEGKPWAGFQSDMLSHLFRRIITIGVYPSCQLLEYACGFEFTAEECTDPHVAKINVLAAILIALANEVYSVGKDFKSNWINVLLLQYFDKSKEVSLSKTEEAGPAFAPKHDKSKESKSAPANMQAHTHKCEGKRSKDLSSCFRYMSTLNDEAIKLFDCTAEEYYHSPDFNAMPEERRKKVSQWVQAVRHCSSGFSMWHSICPRYKKDLVQEKGVGTHSVEWRVENF